MYSLPIGSTKFMLGLVNITTLPSIYAGSKKMLERMLGVGHDKTYPEIYCDFLSHNCAKPKPKKFVKYNTIINLVVYIQQTRAIN